MYIEISSLNIKCVVCRLCQMYFMNAAVGLREKSVGEKHNQQESRACYQFKLCIIWPYFTSVYNECSIPLLSVLYLATVTNFTAYILL